MSRTRATFDKRLVILVMLSCLVVLLGGCKATPVTKKTLILSGFPYNSASYNIKVLAKNGSNVMSEFDYTNIKNFARVEQKIPLFDATETIEVYLYAPDSLEPSYIWKFKYNQAVNSYKTSFWLDYFQLTECNNLVYGISESFVQEVSSLSDETLDFDKSPYYLYKYVGDKRFPLEINVVSAANDILIKVGDTLSQTENDHGFVGNRIADSFTGNQYILITQKWQKPGVNAKVTLTEKRVISIDGRITDFAPSEDPNLVYAINVEQRQLYYINPVKAAIEQSFALGSFEPNALSYSVTGQKLYIAGSNGVTIWNTVTDQADNHIDLPMVLDIEVSSRLRRIYAVTLVDSESWLHIYNMDTLEPLSTTCISDIRSIALDDIKQKLYGGERGKDTSKIFRYSVANDQLTLEEFKYGGVSGGNIILSPDKNHLIFPCGGGNDVGPGYEVYDFDAANFSHVNGQWDIGIYPYSVTFSPDGAYLYGVNGSTNFIYVMDGVNYEEIKTLDFPCASNGAILTTNSDGSVLLSYCTTAPFGTSHFIYFFDKIKRGSDSNRSTGLEWHYNIKDLTLSR